MTSAQDDNKGRSGYTIFVNYTVNYTNKGRSDIIPDSQYE